MHLLKKNVGLQQIFFFLENLTTLKPNYICYNHILNIIQAKLQLYLAQHQEELWLRRNFWVKIILYFELMTCLLFTQFFQFFINCFENHKLQQQGIVI